MAEHVFVHRLTFAVRLVHAVTGQDVSERDVMFLRNRMPLRLRHAQDGLWIAVDMERSGFRMGVKVRGFEETEVSVAYGGISEKDPVLEVFLVPKLTPWNEGELFSLDGTLKGIERLEAVNFSEPDFYVSGYDAKERTLSLFYPHRKRITQKQYGILSKDGQSFEIFTIDEYLPGQVVRLNRRLKNEAGKNAPAAFPIRGTTREDGHYCLRVKKTKSAVWMLHYTVKGKEFFLEMDLQKPKPLRTRKKA